MILSAQALLLSLACAPAQAKVATTSTPSIPAWVSEPSPEYPALAFVSGVGISAKNRESAVAAAQADVGRQIRSRIRSSLNDVQISKRIGSVANSEQSLTKNVRTESDLPLTGVQIVKTENVNGSWYALAVLDKSAYSQQLESRIFQLVHDVKASLQQASQSKSAAKPTLAIASLLSAERAWTQLQDFRALRLSWSTAVVDTFTVSRATFDTLYESVLADLKVTTLSGSEQSAVAGKEWDAPLKIKVEAGGKPVPGFLLGVWDDNDNFLQKISTGTDGIASLWLPPVRPKPGRISWLVKPRLDVPDALRPSLDALNQKIHGTVTPLPFPVVEWMVEGDSASALEPDLRGALAKSGVKTRSGGSTRIFAKLKATRMEKIQSFDNAIEGMALEVSLTLEGPGLNGLATPLRANAYGKSPLEALRKAVGELNWSKALEELNHTQNTGVASVRKVGIVILEAPQEGDEEQIAAAQLSSHLQNAIGRDTRVQLLERTKLDRLYHEVSAQLSGLFETSGEIMRQSGADALILGEVHSGPKGLEIDARMVEVSTGKVLSTSSQTILNGDLRSAAKSLGRELIGRSLN